MTVCKDLFFLFIFLNLYLPLDHILLILGRREESGLKAAVLTLKLLFFLLYSNSQVKDACFPKAHLAFLGTGEGNQSDFRCIASFRNISKLPSVREWYFQIKIQECVQSAF